MKIITFARLTKTLKDFINVKARLKADNSQAQKLKDAALTEFHDLAGTEKAVLIRTTNNLILLDENPEIVYSYTCPLVLAADRKVQEAVAERTKAIAEAKNDPSKYTKTTASTLRVEKLSASKVPIMKAKYAAALRQAAALGELVVGTD